MIDKVVDHPTAFDPWNPGIQSQVPQELLPHLSLLKEENITQTFSEVEEIIEFTGMPREDVVAFRPQRLVVHELLIRIATNYSVSDGNQYVDLGVNFREMAQTIFEKHLQPKLPEIIAQFKDYEHEVKQVVTLELQHSLYEEPVQEEPKGFWKKIFQTKSTQSQNEDPVIRETRLIQSWGEKAKSANSDKTRKSIYKHLTRVCSAIMAKHGRIRGDLSFLATLITQQVCNEVGSKYIGSIIEPLIESGAQSEGYSELPIQSNPVVMNVKGSSASGKSTMRPMQKKLVEALELRWEEFALISPDIFRKFLIDYESLGKAYKYASSCAGHELKIVDQKLDDYVAKKAKVKGVTNLLIDRFRFDSFKADSTVQGSNLLTRFGSSVYMFYMLTPPDQTVERAYSRGQKVGRYKAVDDLLDHNVETFTGMPELFFTWALNKEKSVHYEFLDNSVPIGKVPRTVAFGKNGNFKILDINCLIDIDRFRKININATSAQEVYPAASVLDVNKNLVFIKECFKRLDSAEIIDPSTSRVVLRSKEGKLKEIDAKELEKTLPDIEIRQSLLDLFTITELKEAADISEPKILNLADFHILGELP